MHTSRRVQLSSLLTALGDRVGSAVAALVHKSPLLAERRLVTELRRRYVPLRSSPRTLAERLQRQRTVQQRLVPHSVTVDKSRQYVVFAWPAHAAAALQRQLDTEDNNNDDDGGVVGNDNKDEQNNNNNSHTTTLTRSSANDDVVDSTQRRQHNNNNNTTTDDGGGDVVRTRALAEYLRIMSPSTDNASGILLYGRRGVTVRSVTPVGGYALRFVFSDDHDGGIYSYEYLYSITTSPYKYACMRNYVRRLRAQRKSRDPPRRRAASARHYAASSSSLSTTTPTTTATTATVSASSSRT